MKKIILVLLMVFMFGCIAEEIKVQEVGIDKSYEITNIRNELDRTVTGEITNTGDTIMTDILIVMSVYVTYQEEAYFTETGYIEKKDLLPKETATFNVFFPAFYGLSTNDELGKITYYVMYD